MQCAWALKAEWACIWSLLKSAQLRRSGSGVSLAALSLLVDSTVHLIVLLDTFTRKAALSLLVDSAVHLNRWLHSQENRVYVGYKVVFVQSRGTSTSGSLPLYLAAHDSDQATSGHIWLPMLRPLVHGLAPEKGILYCHRDEDSTLHSAFLLRDPDGLSQVKFHEGAQLIVWPDEDNWEGKFCTYLHCTPVQPACFAKSSTEAHNTGASTSAGTETLSEILQDGLHQLYNVVLGSCQHVAEFISMPCVESKKQDRMSGVCNQPALVLQKIAY